MRFYTFPRGVSDYPYFLLNIRQKDELYKNCFEHAIMDSGVMIFVKAKVKEYPGGFLERYKFLAQQLSMIFKEKLWFVIPDYPDDYNPGQFGDNVSKSLENIKDFIKLEGVNWLPVLQSRYLDRFSFFHACQETRQIIGEDYPYIAIGTVCKCRKIEFIQYCSKVARKFFPNSWIHAFGLTLKAIPKVKGIIDSFDSMAWTFPRQSGHSAKNKRELKTYFLAYLERVNELLEVKE